MPWHALNSGDVSLSTTVTLPAPHSPCWLTTTTFIPHKQYTHCPPAGLPAAAPQALLARHLDLIDLLEGGGQGAALAQAAGDPRSCGGGGEGGGTRSKIDMLRQKMLLGGERGRSRGCDRPCASAAWLPHGARGPCTLGCERCSRSLLTSLKRRCKLTTKLPTSKCAYRLATSPHTFITAPDRPDPPLASRHQLPARPGGGGGAPNHPGDAGRGDLREGVQG